MRKKGLIHDPPPDYRTHCFIDDYELSRTLGCAPSDLGEMPAEQVDVLLLINRARRQVLAEELDAIGGGGAGTKVDANVYAAHVLRAIAWYLG